MGRLFLLWSFFLLSLSMHPPLTSSSSAAVLVPLILSTPHSLSLFLRLCSPTFSSSFAILSIFIIESLGHIYSVHPVLSSSSSSPHILSLSLPLLSSSFPPSFSLSVSLVHPVHCHPPLSLFLPLSCCYFFLLSPSLSRSLLIFKAVL